jgi:putative hydrolase of the HAD superfamily
VYISPEKMRKLYNELNRAQRVTSPEEFPEFDVQKIFREIIESSRPSGMSAEKCDSLAVETSLIFRAASRRKLEPYPHVREVLDKLKNRYIFAAVSDGQSLWAKPEMCAAGLEEYFSSIIVSGNYGFRKPDSRMYTMALEKYSLKPQEVIFVGNDMFRDIYGAGKLGMKTVFFKSNQGDHKSRGIEADYIIYDFNELPRAVEFIENTLK